MWIFSTLQEGEEARITVVKSGLILQELFSITNVLFLIFTPQPMGVHFRRFYGVEAWQMNTSKVSPVYNEVQNSKELAREEYFKQLNQMWG